MRAAVVHAFDQPLCIDERPTPTPGHGQGITGSVVGTRVDLAETFEFLAQGRTRVVRETRQLDEVNESFEQVEKGEIDARLIFDFRQ
jgi:propanol-preferring alcohol dehydrogenase